LIIPDTYNGLPVTEYERNLFHNLEYIKIGCNIQKLYEKSFNSSIRYEEFSSNGTLNEIEFNAFYDTKNLEYYYERSEKYR
jgi:hypothetical protein